MTVPIDIITCPQWGARKPKSGLSLSGAPSRFIFHHTAGHHREISGPKSESREETIRYARDIQAYHMDQNGWVDSGHNFLVCRNGIILQGRWLTVSAIQAHHMVVSAHCPGQNTQVGIEHEHYGDEAMTAVQKEASAVLQAWVSWKLGKKRVLPAHPHSEYYATACPANLKGSIRGISARAQSILGGGL